MNEQQHWNKYFKSTKHPVSRKVFGEIYKSINDTYMPSYHDKCKHPKIQPESDTGLMACVKCGKHL